MIFNIRGKLNSPLLFESRSSATTLGLKPQISFKFLYRALFQLGSFVLFLLSLETEATESRLRIRNFSEYMTPSLEGSSSAVPSTKSNIAGQGAFVPTNIFNIFSIDYPITERLRILYYQRAYFFLGRDNDFSGGQLVLRDPRFGIRMAKVFDVPGLNTLYDVYIQPKATYNPVLSTKNNYEIGFRTNTNYTPAGSNLVVVLGG
jgi:hypothetical protein